MEAENLLGWIIEQVTRLYSIKDLGSSNLFLLLAGLKLSGKEISKKWQAKAFKPVGNLKSLEISFRHLKTLFRGTENVTHYHYLKACKTELYVLPPFREYPTQKTHAIPPTGRKFV